jgi:hypothetical protein
MTAAKNPVHIEAVAARAPCREEKKVPMRAGSAEPVKIPVMFYRGGTVSIMHSFTEGIFVGEKTHIDEAQINLDAVKHSSKSSHENGKASNTPVPCTQNLAICSFGVDVCKEIKLGRLCFGSAN